MNHSTQAHFSQQEAVSFRASAVGEEEEEGGRLLTVSLLAAGLPPLLSLPALPHKQLPENALVSPCSLLPFPGARHLCFPPGLSPLQTHISLPMSCLCFPHISGDGEVPLEPADRSDHKGLKEPEISMERQVATGQTSWTCRKLGENQRDGVWHPWGWGSEEMKSKAALIHWFTPGQEAVYYAAAYLGFIHFFLPSLLSDSQSHSIIAHPAHIFY